MKIGQIYENPRKSLQIRKNSPKSENFSFIPVRNCKKSHKNRFKSIDIHGNLKKPWKFVKSKWKFVLKIIRIP